MHNRNNIPFNEKNIQKTFVFWNYLMNFEGITIIVGNEIIFVLRNAIYTSQSISTTPTMITN